MGHRNLNLGHSAGMQGVVQRSFSAGFGRILPAGAWHAACNIRSRKPAPKPTGRERFSTMSITEMKAASKLAAKNAAAARAALAKAEKLGFREFVERISKLDPTKPIAVEEVVDLVEWAAQLLG